MISTDEFPETITIGDQEYTVSSMNEQALAQLRGVHFCDQQIQQLNNEWAIADTARLGYLHALKLEMPQPQSQSSEVDDA
ncbi:hypothetical protein RAZWK3B_11967 [Roseobacter sp. AzwK-3b]|uniref:DUF6447 family protein n=1 Tax=Roseobacter sp. AzwK-3b TaxID=351016 RepID=UPI000156A74D|nr:DUF6447 family protein [Roseobacter sp. AzwK-3b]EDM69612.1 hypothetical protein RAZWK3B_11967 [Roseobacter sp. AzwK-3b]